jgi:hypothetical protein
MTEMVSFSAACEACLLLNFLKGEQKSNEGRLKHVPPKK